MTTRPPHFRRGTPRFRAWIAAATLAACGVSAAPAHAADAASGGDTTRAVSNRNAFSSPARNLPPQWRQRFFDGNKLFNAEWAAPPNRGSEFVGLGPTFNARSCIACHVRDGRGAPPENDAPMTTMLVRVSVPGRDANGGPLPHPFFGMQLNDKAVEEVAPEGRVRISYVEQPGVYGDGAPFSLRAPTYALVATGVAPDGALLMSPRVAPAVFGLGLLEAIPEAAIVAMADPEDADGDGISGRANRVHDPIAETTLLGRFGWKANVATLRSQNAEALLGDIGITSPPFPEDNCPEPQAACRARAAQHRAIEATDAQLDLLTFYMESVAVPARRDVEAPAVQRGERLFGEIGCTACHTPRIETGDHANPVAAYQTIQPFTDLLLHDMGDGLADGRPDFDADGREWRTPPLWGLGLIETVNGHLFLLHDGRARGIAEAILWHGGEAEAARERFRNLPAGARNDLLAFLGSL
jgi:CxxC motif-containing protein (DUF1111 family)